MSKPNDAVLALLSEDVSRATFEVVFTGHKNVNKYELWVQLTGLNAQGDRSNVSENWISSWVGDTAIVTVPKLPDGETAIVSYSAYVWHFPDPLSPVSNLVMF